jgi:hypothetical protein
MASSTTKCLMLSTEIIAMKSLAEALADAFPDMDMRTHTQTHAQAQRHHSQRSTQPHVEQIKKEDVPEASVCDGEIDAPVVMHDGERVARHESTIAALQSEAEGFRLRIRSLEEEVAKEKKTNNHLLSGITVMQLLTAVHVDE